MKKMNLGFIMVGLVFLISISVLSCQADEADDYFQQAEDVTAADLFIASEAYQNLQKEIRKGIRRRRNPINELASDVYKRQIQRHLRIVIKNVMVIWNKV